MYSKVSNVFNKTKFPCHDVKTSQRQCTQVNPNPRDIKKKKKNSGETITVDAIIEDYLDNCRCISYLDTYFYIFS